MGADIYLMSVHKETEAKWRPVFEEAVAARNAVFSNWTPSMEDHPLQKAVEDAYEKMLGEGYFRDSYNSSSLFALLGLSWWSDVIPMLDKEGNLPIENAAKLRQMILDAGSITLTRVRRRLHERNDESPSPSLVAEWFAHWKKRREELLKMIDQSIALNEPLCCSL